MMREGVAADSERSGENDLQGVETIFNIGMFVLDKGIQDNFLVFPFVACSLPKECYDI